MKMNSSLIDKCNLLAQGTKTFLIKKGKYRAKLKDQERLYRFYRFYRKQRCEIEYEKSKYKSNENENKIRIRINIHGRIVFPKQVY